MYVTGIISVRNRTSCVEAGDHIRCVVHTGESLSQRIDHKRVLDATSVLVHPPRIRLSVHESITALELVDSIGLYKCIGDPAPCKCDLRLCSCVCSRACGSKHGGRIKASVDTDG